MIHGKAGGGVEEEGESTSYFFSCIQCLPGILVCSKVMVIAHSDLDCW